MRKGLVKERKIHKNKFQGKTRRVDKAKEGRKKTKRNTKGGKMGGRRKLEHIFISIIIHLHTLYKHTYIYKNINAYT